MTQYQKAILKKMNEKNKLGLISSNFIQNLKLQHQKIIPLQSYGISKIHQVNQTKKIDKQQSQEIQPQSGMKIQRNQQYYDDQWLNDTEEQVKILIPYKSFATSLISSLKPSKLKTYKNSIQENKRLYQQIVAKKQVNRKKFIQKLKTPQNRGNSDFQKLFFKQLKQNNQNSQYQQEQCSNQNQQMDHFFGQQVEQNEIIKNKSKESNRINYKNFKNGQQSKLKKEEQNYKLSHKQNIKQHNQNSQNSKQNKQSPSQSENISQNKFNKQKNDINSVRKIQRSQKKIIKLKRQSSMSSCKKQKSNGQYQISSQNPNYGKQNHEIKQNDSISKRRQSAVSLSKNQFLLIEKFQNDQKQIMSRLLNIIQKQKDQPLNSIKQFSNQNMYYQRNYQQPNLDRSDSYMRQNSLANSKKIQNSDLRFQYSSAKPIVINNFIKSPTDKINRSLIEREIAIKLLEQNRNNKSMKNSVKQSRLVSQSRLINSISREQSDKKQRNFMLTSKSPISNQQSAQIDFEDLYNKLRRKLNGQNINSVTQSQLDQSKQTTSQFIKKQHKKESIRQQQNQQSQITTKTTIKTFQQQIQSPISSNSSASKTTNKKSATQKQKQKQDKKLQHQPLECNLNVQNSKQPKQIIKQSVFMQISFNNELQHHDKNITLADAFKKKFGASKFTQAKTNINKQSQTKNNLKSMDFMRKNNKVIKQNEALSQLKLQCNDITKSAQQKHSANVDKDSSNLQTVKKKMVKINKKSSNGDLKQIRIQDKQNYAFIKTPRSNSQNTLITDRSICTNAQSISNKQPSKQLLDRLIYGGRANMTKQEMYSLTKKNYLKLPEVQQKKKLQAKRQAEVERLQKVKQYQRRIRSNKTSISKNITQSAQLPIHQSMKTSVHNFINQ